MTPEETRRKAIQFFTEGANGRVDPAELADGYIVWNPQIGELTAAQAVGLAAQFGGLFKGPLAVHVDGTTVEGNRVAIEARSDGELINGVRYANTYHVLVEFDDAGKVKRMNEHLDSQHMVDTVGPLFQAAMAAPSS